MVCAVKIIVALALLGLAACSPSAYLGRADNTTLVIPGLARFAPRGLERADVFVCGVDTAMWYAIYEDTVFLGWAPNGKDSRGAMVKTRHVVRVRLLGARLVPVPRDSMMAYHFREMRKHYREEKP